MNKLETLIIVIVLGVIFVRLVIYWVVEYGKRQARKARKFEDLYQTVDDMVRFFARDSKHYDIIEEKIGLLRAMKYNREKVDVLEDEFHRQFGKEFCERLLKTL